MWWRKNAVLAEFRSCVNGYHPRVLLRRAQLCTSQDKPAFCSCERNMSTYFWSMMRTLKPTGASAFAHMRPAGPAPTMRTSTKLPGADGVAMVGQRRRVWSHHSRRGVYMDGREPDSLPGQKVKPKILYSTDTI